MDPKPKMNETRFRNLADGSEFTEFQVIKNDKVIGTFTDRRWAEQFLQIAKWDLDSYPEYQPQVIKDES